MEAVFNQPQVIENPPLQGLEATFDSVGARTPATRFLVGAGVGAGVVFALKPSSMFKPDGSPREWSLVSDSDSATGFPWYMGVILPGFLMGVLV